MSTTVKLGWTDPLTDTFGAHPSLGAVLDLNDGVTFTLASPEGLMLSAPPRTVVQTGNIRTQGERVTRAIYRHNRGVTCQLVLGPAASYAAFVASLRTLLAWLNGPPQQPFSIQYQPFNATSPVYLDVVACAHGIPEDEAQWLRLQFEPVEVTFLCKPGLRGDRIRLQNLAPNPGFEQPSAPGVQAFADPFATVNAYTVVAGGGPTLGPAQTYVDVVQADAPLRYYRLGETGGSSAYDVSGNGQTGTVANATQGVAGALSGDSDTAYTFNGTSAKVGVPTAGLPTGNAPWSIECWVKITANPASNRSIMSFGNQANGKGAPQFYLTTTGQVSLATVGGDTPGTALSTGVWHHLAGTWDGTTLKLYLDGSLSQSATPGALNVQTGSFYCNLGCEAAASPAQWFPGSLDECAIYGVALSAARIAAHYNAGHTGASGTVANAASIPGGGQVAFGSPEWGPVNTWALRFRYVSTLTSFAAYLHYTDASNYLRALVTGTQIQLQHVVAGVQTVIATGTLGALVHEAWYWLSLTQFPVPGPYPPQSAIPVGADPPYVAATLAYDAAGSVGSSIVGIGGPCADALTAELGRPQIQATGAALAIGGLSSGGGHAVSLFGPSGWLFRGNDGTGLASGAWEQDGSKTYAGGRVNSLGAARIDAGPSGTLDARWHLTTGGASIARSSAVPVAAPGDVLAIAAQARSSGLGASAAVKLTVDEYDAGGNLLRTDAGWSGGGGGAPSLTAAQTATYASLSGQYTTGTNCAYVDVSLRVTDPTTGSAGGTAWFENVQVWDKTACSGQSSMPYCELRFPHSPATLVVTGLVGDLPAPAYLGLGTLAPQSGGFAPGTTLTFAVGRAARASASARFDYQCHGFYGGALTPQSVAALDPGSYGGYYVQAAVTSSGWNPHGASPKASDMPGVYHLWTRFYSGQATGNIGNVQVRVVTVQQGSPWYGRTDFADQYATYYGPFTAPLAAGSTWTLADAGQVTLPPYAQGALTDPSQTYLTPRAQWTDATGGGSTCRSNWHLLLPVDGSLVVGVWNNPNNAGASVSGWVWQYLDPLGTLPNGYPASATYSAEAAALANPARGAGGPGTQTTGTPNVNLGADPYLVLDPQVNVPNGQPAGQGVNQMGAVVTDGVGDVLAVYCDLAYSPLFLYPR